MSHDYESLVLFRLELFVPVRHVLTTRNSALPSPGFCLAIFAAVLQEIYYFKPQTITVSIIFLAVIAYVLGEVFALLPRFGLVGRFLNPFPFNSKEHVFIVIMASSGATSAVATEILAAQRLYYDMKPNPGAAIFLVISSQLLGYGIAGLLRGLLVQPTKMLWPINLPVNSLLETLHRDRAETWKRLRVFLIIFAFMFFYEIIPVRRRCHTCLTPLAGCSR